LPACRSASAPFLEDQALPTLPFTLELQQALEDGLEAGRGGFDLGVSAAISVPGHAPRVGVSGFSQPGVLNNSEMVFGAGSVAKMFEAALAMRLVEDGSLDLETPISSYLPELRTVNHDVTIRQLLNHTSGTFNVFEHPSFPWVGTQVDYGKSWPLSQVFESFVREPYGLPGTVQNYSSTNYLLLTEILLKAGNLNVSDQVQKLLLEPQQMDCSLFSVGSLPPDEILLAHPWVDLDNDGDLEDIFSTVISWKISLTHPVLYTTPLDLTRWMRALFVEQSVLSKESLNQMLTYPADVDLPG
jgi:D-alanyl-D-alanine carboxypeptidase